MWSVFILTHINMKDVSLTLFHRNLRIFSCPTLALLSPAQQCFPCHQEPLFKYPCMLLWTYMIYATGLKIYYKNKEFIGNQRFASICLHYQWSHDLIGGNTSSSCLKWFLKPSLNITKSLHFHFTCLILATLQITVTAQIQTALLTG